MKLFRTIFLTSIFLVPATLCYSADILQFTAKAGFVQADDIIVEHQLVDNDRKLLLIGRQNIQLWDVAAGKLVTTTPHKIAQFAPKGFVTNLFTLGLVELFSWKPYYVEPSGKWIATIEKNDPAVDHRLVVIRDLSSAKQIATLDVPEISTDYISYDENKGEILTFGQMGQAATLANWNKENFGLRQKISFDDYKWHQFIGGETKMVVGSGDSKTVWSGANIKQGDRLTLRDVNSGAIENDFTAKSLLPRSPFQETTISADEKYLFSKRDDRLFVWEIGGDGQPRFEITSANPRSKPKFVSILAGRYIVTSLEKKLAVYDMAGNGAPLYTLTATLPTDSITISDSTEDGKYIAVVDDAEALILETGGNGVPIYKIARKSEKERFSAVAFLENQDYLFVSRVNRSEKQPGKTEFYDIKTGKLVFDIPTTLGSNAQSTPSGKYLYAINLGSVTFWDTAEKRLFTIPLNTATPSGNYDPQSNVYVDTAPYNNAEKISISPDEKFVLRSGDDVVSIIDLETGNEVQSIFDRQKVKYDKRNKVKRSGLGDAAWAADGRAVYAFDTGGFLGRQRTVSFWTKN